MRSKLLQRESMTGYFYGVRSPNIVGIFEFEEDVKKLINIIPELKYIKTKQFEKAEKWVTRRLIEKDLEEFNLLNGHIRINGVHIRNRSKPVRDFHKFIDNIDKFERYEVCGNIYIEI